ncbi:MAG: thioredoxin family protein [Planctomycetota bacterium]
MFDFAAKFADGLTYEAFLDAHGSDADREKWALASEHITLTPDQTALIESFTREMPVFCVAGAWCGDCVSQCPILHRIASVNEKILLRFFDRDAHPDLANELQVCGAPRVPSVLFLAEDFAPTGRYGDKTLAKYRKLGEELSGAACSIGQFEPDALQNAVTAEWLEQFERNQLILRTSGRLRKKHGD